MKSIWQAGVDSLCNFPELADNIETDVVIVGAGITGLTTAQQLIESGKRVVILEAHRVGSGCTGGATGNLYSPVSSGLAQTGVKWDDDTLQAIVQARAGAIDLIEETVHRFNIDCQFKRVPLYRLLTENDQKSAEALEAEHEAMMQAGLNAKSFLDMTLPFPVTHGVSVDHQAQFNAFHYVQGLAKAISQHGVTIYEHSPVRDIDYENCIVKTDNAQVKAADIVLATHTPKGVNMLQTGMIASREYGVSAKLNAESFPDGIFFVLDPFHSVRSYRLNGENYIMAIGEKHQTGEEKSERERYQALRSYLSAHFDVGEFEYEWSAQQYSSGDGLPYIGRTFASDHVYVATGFAADGLTWGTVSGRMIADIIEGRENAWYRCFDSQRFTPVNSAEHWLKENISVVKHFIKDHFGTKKLKELDEVAPGQAKVVTLHGEKLAVYRNETGHLSVLSAVCPHLKCVVHWNDAETTWDCPCHGSRFDLQGEVIEGPSLHPLEHRHSSSS
ncbi:FAD-dependent oxidoreductase [Vreelandella populi]|uniref:FAD-dependent oxidoreductase n=1 Tax=Vreelandella populi TaxID=2498858 RepID=A0A433LG77_9GAMM|nr:FAD-dependent oxidoreductase [Halomonas populi]RUR37912.1 FAD-dependent oxidoreductase [Halomonas populi]RUR48890.1 FAD-dependent oxidoreductase [Halomonas populi]RUR55234.1 FAD-dependent oxidoreductase [Halomonas populi]